MSRRLLRCGMAWTLVLAFVWPGWAQEKYPVRPITVIVPMNPGGGTDLVGRAFAEALKKQLNQSFAVENVPGAGSAIGTTKLHGSKPDGYTLGVVGGFLVSTSLLGAAKFPATDLTHIARLSQETFVLSVASDAPWKTLAEFLDAIRKEPGKITLGTAGSGATVMIAPLMTCSARLPVYALIIAAYIPRRTMWGSLELQGLVLFVLYAAGVAGAMAVAYVVKRFTAGSRFQPLMLELPAYHWSHLRNLAIGLWQRAQIFLTRVGTIVLALMILLWALSSFPAPPPDATGPAIQYSIAGRIGAALAVVFEPIGFNWQISLALVPGLAAREVAVGALGTVYALAATGDDVAHALTPLIAASWSLPSALSLLSWYVFAPQCLSTLATVKRETNSWRYPVIMAAYLFALAYAASFVTYRVAMGWMGSA